MHLATMHLCTISCAYGTYIYTKKFKVNKYSQITEDINNLACPCITQEGEAKQQSRQANNDMNTC